MNAVPPVWDGNETWLILGGGGLTAAFPLAYAIVLPALYAPLIAMLLGLVFRGVAFKFRWRDPRYRGLWDAAFCAESYFASDRRVPPCPADEDSAAANLRQNDSITDRR